MKGRAIDALSECACTGPANPRGGSYVAYRLVHCLAILSCSALLVIYWVAILPTRGSAEKKKKKGTYFRQVKYKFNTRESLK